MRRTWVATVWVESVEQSRDLRVAEALHDVGQDLALACRRDPASRSPDRVATARNCRLERLRRSAAGDTAPPARLIGEPPSSSSRIERPTVSADGVLEQVAERARLDRRDDVLFVAEHGDHHAHRAASRVRTRRISSMPLPSGRSRSVSRTAFRGRSGGREWGGMLACRRQSLRSSAMSRCRCRRGSRVAA